MSNKKRSRSSSPKDIVEQELEEDERAFQTINRIIQLQDNPLSFVPTSRNIITVPGDGDCLFHALSHELNRTNVYNGTQFHLRQMICNTLQHLLDTNQLEEHIRDKFGEIPEEYLPFDNYIKDMRKPLVWGGDLEISVIPLIFEGITVEIWMKPTKGSQNLDNISGRSTGDNSNTIRLFNTRSHKKGDIGNHFDVVSFYKQPLLVGRKKKRSPTKKTTTTSSSTSSSFLTLITPYHKPMTFKQVQDVWNKQILEIANFTTSLINSKNLLFHAASVGNIIAVRMLLFIGVNVNNSYTDERITPLMIACRGKSPTWIDDDKNTIANNFELVVKELLQNWSDYELKDRNDKTALEYALEANLENIVNLFLPTRGG